MASLLCLAHYCDTHGPTPLMVTEGLPVVCVSCTEDDNDDDSNDNSSLTTQQPSINLRSLSPTEIVALACSQANLNSSDVGNGSQSKANSSAIETPPESPRLQNIQTSQFGLRRDSSYRKTYDENDKKRAIPCENCALTLPRPTKEGSGRIDSNGPILRTRKPYERVSRPLAATEELSPPKSSSSSTSSNAASHKASKRRQPQASARADTSSSNSSFGIGLLHDHFLDYTSTHESLAPNSFSIIRQSCLRTLSCETLPPSSSQPTSPSSPFINNPFSTGPSSSTQTSSGGPIFFGDPLAGYTTAYIFRIPDPNARGRRRVYALMALSTHRERLAMSTFSFLSTAFRDLAAWIQGLAEAELERSEAVNSPRLYGDTSIHNTPTSSFLSGRNRGPDGKFAGMSLRARGLAELVGLPDFFIELHARFVRLLLEMSLVIGA